MKVKKKFVMLMVPMLLAGVLSGCGDMIPTLTDEENWKIAEYSAGLLLKYDAHNIRRLVSDNIIQAAYEEAYKMAEWEWKVEQYKEQQRQEEMAASNNHSSSENGDGESAPAISYTMEEILGIEGSFQLTYTGCEVTDSYCSEGYEDIFGAMEATSGNQLVILHFDLYNITGEDLFCDLIHQSVKYSATINDKKYGAQMTLLLDDLTQYYDTVPAYSSKSAVVVFQLPESEAFNIQSISLRLKSGEMSNRFVLQ